MTHEEQHAKMVASSHGTVAYKTKGLPSISPSYPDIAFIVIRERTFPDALASEIAPASGHTHYAWSGVWQTAGGELPIWAPFIKDYRDWFELYPSRKEAEADAKRLIGMVALAILR